MIRLEPFSRKDFSRLISWVDSKELLITIAGDVFAFPLSTEQLQDYLEAENSYSFNIVDVEADITIGHAEILLSGKDMYKIDKLIIGEASNRGKGIGQQVIHILLTHCFDTLRAKMVELNVFDWNTRGIRCYKKCGFRFNADKKTIFRYDDRNWTALNMIIDKEGWVNKNMADAEATGKE